MVTVAGLLLQKSHNELSVSFPAQAEIIKSYVNNQNIHGKKHGTKGNGAVMAGCKVPLLLPSSAFPS